MNIRLANHDHVVDEHRGFLIVEHRARYYVCKGLWRIRMAGCDTIQKAKRRIEGMAA